jgi:hypothetical protein
MLDKLQSVLDKFKNLLDKFKFMLDKTQNMLDTIRNLQNKTSLLHKTSPITGQFSGSSPQKRITYSKKHLMGALFYVF